VEDGWQLEYDLAYVLHLRPVFKHEINQLSILMESVKLAASSSNDAFADSYDRL
jgi:hypothetical protein